MLRDQPYQRGADDEHGDGELEDALAAEEVAELAVDRQTDGGGQEIGGDRPGHLVEAVQLADDLRERGGDDHLVERCQQQRQHESEEDHPDPARAEAVVGELPLLHGRSGLGVRGRFRRFYTGPGSLVTSVVVPTCRSPRRACAAYFSHYATTAGKRDEGRLRRVPGANAPVGALRRTTARERKTTRNGEHYIGVTSPPRRRASRGPRRRCGRDPWGRRSSRRSRRCRPRRSTRC